MVKTLIINDELHASLKSLTSIKKTTLRTYVEDKLTDAINQEGRN